MKRLAFIALFYTATFSLAFWVDWRLIPILVLFGTAMNLENKRRG